MVGTRVSGNVALVWSSLPVRTDRSVQQPSGRTLMSRPLRSARATAMGRVRSPVRASCEVFCAVSRCVGVLEPAAVMTPSRLPPATSVISICMQTTLRLGTASDANNQHICIVLETRTRSATSDGYARSAVTRRSDTRSIAKDALRNRFQRPISRSDMLGVCTCVR
jgi:hypothetical protein